MLLYHMYLMNSIAFVVKEKVCMVHMYNYVDQQSYSKTMCLEVEFEELGDINHSAFITITYNYHI